MTTTEERPRAEAQPSRRRPSALAVGLSGAILAGGEAWRRMRPWRGWRWLSRAGGVVFVVALPLALIGGNVRLLFTSSPLYDSAVEQYDVPAVTGLPRPEVDRSMDEIRAYFTDDQSLLRITVTDERGRGEPLFTPREVIHMRDVKELVQSIFTLQFWATVFVLGYAIVRLVAERRAALSDLARLTRGSMIGLLAVGVAFGAATALGFERLFEQFHVLSFSNDFWQLDPARDRLVQMFPFDFWLVSTVLLVGLTLVEAFALLGLSWAYLQRQRPKPAD